MEHENRPRVPLLLPYNTGSPSGLGHENRPGVPPGVPPPPPIPGPPPPVPGAPYPYLNRPPNRRPLIIGVAVAVLLTTIVVSITRNSVAGQPTLTIQQFAHMLNNSDLTTGYNPDTDSELIANMKDRGDKYRDEPTWYTPDSECSVSARLPDAASKLIGAVDDAYSLAGDYTWLADTNYFFFTTPEEARTFTEALSDYRKCNLAQLAQDPDFARLEVSSYAATINGVRLVSDGTEQASCGAAIWDVDIFETMMVSGCTQTTVMQAQYGNVIIFVVYIDHKWKEWTTDAVALQPAVDAAAKG